MGNGLKPVQDYIGTIEKELVAGNATEHTHRPALKMLVESLAEGITATNEPQRTECGALDFLVSKGAFQVGYIEAKDVGKSLDEAEKSEQLKRYLGSLTDYLEFRWYVDRERRFSARLGTPTKDGKIKRDKAGIQAVAKLLSDFLVHEAKAVGTPKELAERMARLAHRLRDLVTAAFKKKLPLPTLNGLYKAFCDTLIADLTTEQFADMYAQTIAYGLFAARCNAPEGATFTRQHARDLVPKTNPFLRNIFDHIAGAGLPEIIAPEVDDLVQLLAQADMASILKDFGKRTAKEDPVVHFYETFLAEYDPKVREMRGVYYTPEPVVSYIVCSIDHLLKTRFNRPQGLMDANTLILDPAVSTATFLYMVINEIHQAMVSQGQKGMWNDYVAEKLLPRIFGFELLMAPYAVAHLKLGLLLQETGYQFKSDQRLGIYLTNTLEEAIKYSEVLFVQWITEEANAAAQIKKEKPIMVVLGNPPYSGHSVNKGPWAKQLVEKYKTVDGKPLGEKNPKWLQDDYVKFLAFGQWRIELSGQGILGFITNHAYLDNPTFRGMRQSLLNSSFTDIYILNLHGNVKKKEVAPDGSKDENVFDIQQGVAVGLFIKEIGKDSPAKVHYAELWGLREGKYHTLLETDIDKTEWVELTPSSPFYLFVPVQENLLNEYEKGWKVTDIFPSNSVGIVTARDHFVLDFDEANLKQRITDFRATVLSDDEVRERFKLSDKEGWSVTGARQTVRQDKDYEKAFTRCLYRPFDSRPIFYHKAVIERSRPKVMRHMLARENLGLITVRQVAEGVFDHTFVSRSIVESRITLSNKGIGFLFPLYLYPAEGELQFEEGRRPNLNPEFIKAVSDKLGLKFIEDGNGDLKETFGPEDIFDYAYAVFHSLTYRSRYAEFLRIDFPRLPLTSDKELFKTLVEKGAELVSLHLMESPVLEQQRTQIKFDVSGSNVVEKVTYNETAKRVYINKDQYFEGVLPEVWNFHIGGYQVCQKWLKDRKGRILTYDERVHYQKVVVALKETIRLMEKIDQLIPSWPIE
ncbi:N-6 DNA methylase [Dehalococcoidales bacterium]|nr:N-6 DNA methylase [Dehalococcoidales bacterium]